jgi:alpha-amylase
MIRWSTRAATVLLATLGAFAWSFGQMLLHVDGEALTAYRQDDPAGLRFTHPGLVKTLALDGSTVTVTWHCSGLAGRRFTTRLNLAMPSCDGFLGRYVLADGSIPGGFGQPIDLPAASALTLEDGVLGGSIRLVASIPAEICGRPQQTVSQSEAGFEKIMQCVELSFTWTVPDDQSTLQLQLTTQQSPS